jgi:hypothetical protein
MTTVSALTQLLKVTKYLNVPVLVDFYGIRKVDHP